MTSLDEATHDLSAPRDLEKVELKIGYRFRRRELLETALRHSSYTHESAQGGEAKIENNERIEFLGDSVLGLVVANALFHAKPEWREGDLSRALHALIEGRSLERLARSFELGEVILLGRTEQQSGGKEKPSILADAMEAVIGAIFLDGGLEPVTALIERAFGDSLTADARVVHRDPKTEFQERVMAVEGEFPSYRLVHDSLVEGDEARFSVEVLVQDEVLAQATGRTKRGAERLAAADALKKWQSDAAADESE